MRSTRGSGGVRRELLVLWYVCVVVCVCVSSSGVRGDISFPLTSLPTLPVVGSSSSISIRGGSFSSAGYTFGNGQVLILADPDAAALVAPAPPMTLTFTLQSMSMTFGSQLVLINLANDRLDRVCRVFVNVPTPTLTFELRDQQTGAVVRTTTSWPIPLNDLTPITITIGLTTHDGFIKNDRGQFQTFRYLQTPTTPLQPFTVGQLVIGDGFTGGSGWSGTIRDFSIVTQASGSGDPQFLGFHGQSFQVHGFPDEIMNLVTMAEFQWNSLFVYLDGTNRVMTRERYNHTQRYSHPGTYLGELYFNTPFANLRIRAGPHELGLTVFNDSHVVQYEGEDGGNVITHQFSDMTLSMISKDRVVIKSQYLSITVDNSDWFVNIGVHQHGLKQSHACGTLTARKTQHLSADDPYHTTCTLHDVNTGEQVHMHGLIGGTYRNIRFAQGRLYEGSPDDYHVASGSSSGIDFAFNQYRGVAGTGHHHAGTH